MTSLSLPEDPALALHIALYYVRLRQLDKAHLMLLPLLEAGAIESDVKMRMQVSSCAAQLIHAYISQRRLGDCDALLRAAGTLCELPPLLRSAADLAAIRGDHALTRTMLKRVLETEPESGDTWLALARACAADGDRLAAHEAYLRAAQTNPTHGVILSIAERVATLVPATGTVPPERRIRIAVIGSSTHNHVQSYLEVSCRVAGLVPSFYLGPYGQYAQDILDDSSPLYAFQPDVVIIAVHGRTLFPDLYDYPFDLDASSRKTAARDVVEHVCALLSQLTRRTQALVLLHTFATPQYSPVGMLDVRDEFGQTAIFHSINDGVAEGVRHNFPSVHLVDEDRVYGRVGKSNVTDPRMWYLARIGVSEGALSALTAEYMRFIKALKGRTRKCIVLDLDNTLWGGVVGEDGLVGIALGQEAPGNAFVAFQQAILHMYKRGVLLAVNSKNNESDAMEVLERHPDMVLRPHHFAAMRINWLDKATNLRSIAEELNIGLDSLAFVDDNPAECVLVRRQLPEVLTVQLPSDPALYRGILLGMTDFDSLTLTDEDRIRGELYAQRRERKAWESNHEGNLESYLGELGMVVDVEAADDYTLPRITQLIGKTNQFNLTTRRHNEATVRAFAGGDAVVYSVRVRDRFGDHGIVGAAILKPDGAVWEVDTLLLSCRVLGRGVETGMLSALVAAARAGGAHILRGVFIDTAKNMPARDVYRRHGFHLSEETIGVQVWELDVRTSDVPVPSWLTLQMPHRVAPASER